jgi:hypothetical protein
VDGWHEYGSTMSRKKNGNDNAQEWSGKDATL